MSTTPRTDAEAKRFNHVESFDDRDTVPADFARALETELAAMTLRAEKAEADTARMGWLEQHRDVSQCYDEGDPEVGLFPRWELFRHIGKHGENLWDYVSYGETLRSAIDAAMKETARLNAELLPIQARSESKSPCPATD